MTIEHEPWCGPQYRKQADAERLLIIGFSHWQDAEDALPDRASLTRELFEGDSVFGGHIQFFNTIAGYFGEDGETFWNRVAFANSLPTVVGTGPDRYGAGTREQRGAVADRALRLIESLEPARIFIFSRKAWRLWPDYTGNLKDGTLHAAGEEIDAGTYRHGRGEALAFGLRHPQFAVSDTMRAIVAAAMQADPEALRPSA